jgi:hypothetical protein
VSGPDASPSVADTEACLSDTRVGRRRFLQGVGVAAGTAAIGSMLPSGAARAAPAGASQFIPLPEVKRIVDTREPHLYEFTQHWNNHISIPISGRYGVPHDASAIVATVTAVNLGEGNWLTVVPAHSPIQDLLAQNRLVSALNMIGPGEATANLVQVKLVGGGVELFSRGPCHMIFDVIGYYKPVAGPVREGRFVRLDSARRAIDTRDTVGFVNAGESLIVDLTAYVPSEASSAVVNLTATECISASYFTVYPYTSTTVPFASSLNVNSFNETRAAAVIAPVSTQPDGRRYIKVYASNAAKLIVDVTGYFTSTKSAPSENGLFVPVDPVRILDTRDPGMIGKLWPGWFVEGAIPGDGSLIGSAAVVNLTGVDARQPGFLTMSAARQPLPGTSNLNFTFPGQVVPNHVITPTTVTHGYHVYASGGAHVIVDYTGYYTGTPLIPTLGPPQNPPPPPAAPTWILHVPRMGLVSQVRAGGSNAVTNAGHSWHWTGTGYLGQDAHVAAFAHRTTAGGPYRNLHWLEGGDQFTLSTGDGRVYTYQVVDRFLTDFRTQNILDATRFIPGTTFSLIACTEPNFLPTSTAWRIVVTGVLLGWYSTG